MAKVPGINDVTGALRGQLEYAGRLAQTQLEILASLPATVVALNRSVRRLADTIEQAQQTLLVIQRVAIRLDRLSAEVEEPLQALAPGLRRAARVLDDPVVETIPATLRIVEAEIRPVLRNLRDTEAKIARIAASTERITSFVDDAGRGLSTLPGAGLLGMLRPPRPGAGPGPGV